MQFVIRQRGLGYCTERDLLQAGQHAMLSLLRAGPGAAAGLWMLLAGAFLLALILQCFPVAARCPHALRHLFQDLIRYGKTRSGEGHRLPCPPLGHLPKRWFYHFYLVSVIWNGFLLMVLIQTLFLGDHFPVWLQVLVKILSGMSHNKNLGGSLSAFLVLMLLWLHSIRRLAECLLISVFSNGVINLPQYCFGLAYYVLLGLTVLCQVPFGGRNVSVEDLLEQRCWRHVLGILIYIWASVHQHRCHVILANLRKSKSGEVVNLCHSVPHGDWFEKVSCPHYFAELLIYVAMGVIFGIWNFTWCLVVMYVLFNQALAAVLCHEFYLMKFDSYPKHRKAFIPFVF